MTVAGALAALDPALIDRLTQQTYSQKHLLSIIEKESLSFEDFCALLSNSAETVLPQMATRSRELTQKHFGRAIQLYTPLYLSNACINQCLYCGFQAGHDVVPIVLSDKEICSNYSYLSNLGFGHILLLTGEHPQKAGIGYIEHAISMARDYFPYISLEVFPCSAHDYSRYARAGARGVTLYQETYDPLLYEKLHPIGPKSDYAYRLEGPERALSGGMRQVGLGALLGLSDWKQDGAFLGLHAQLLQKAYWQASLTISFPRIRPIVDASHVVNSVSNRSLVQLICAIRLFLPFVGLTLSTRESDVFRNQLIHLGITQLSAGSNTHPGGYVRESSEPGQFEIHDNRSLQEVMNMLRLEGFDPVLKDWSPLFDSLPFHV